MIKILGKIDIAKSKEKKQLQEKDSKAEKANEIIHFDWDRYKKRIIGRISNGKIAIISYNYKGNIVHAGDDWMCEIQEMENKAIVTPVELITSAEENQSLIESGVKDLLTKDWNKTMTYKKKKKS